MILTPKAAIRLSHGRLHQIAVQVSTDPFDLTDHLTWQMNVVDDQDDAMLGSRGVLNETIAPRLDHAGNRIIQGMEAVRREQKGCEYSEVLVYHLLPHVFSFFACF